jgi:hypothetical protein
VYNHGPGSGISAGMLRHMTTKVGRRLRIVLETQGKAEQRTFIAVVQQLELRLLLRGTRPSIVGRRGRRDLLHTSRMHELPGSFHRS